MKQEVRLRLSDCLLLIAFSVTRARELLMLRYELIRKYKVKRIECWCKYLNRSTLEHSFTVSLDKQGRVIYYRPSKD